MSEVDELKARIEQIKGESESKLKQIADQSSAELRKLQESWCARLPDRAMMTRSPFV